MSVRAGRRHLLLPNRPRFIHRQLRNPNITIGPATPFTLTFSISPGAGGDPSFPGTDSSGVGGVSPPTTNDKITAEVAFTGYAVVTPPAQAALTIDTSVTTSTLLTIPRPTIVSGKPLLVDYVARPDSNMSLNVGPGGIVVIPDPDPTIPGNSQPGGVTPAYVWTANDLRDPSSGSYDLKTWKPHGGTGPQWKSTSEYAPRVVRTLHYGAGRKYHTFTKGVHFDADEVEHMWMDWGSNLSQPFTVLITAIIHYYPQRTFGHYLLDSGTSTPGGLNDGDDHVFSEGLSYRSLMLYQQSSAILATHTGADAARDGKHVRVRHNFAPRPRMFFGIFNGSSSYIGSWDRHDKYMKKGTIDTKTHRYFVMGRRNGRVSDNLGAHMTVFEIRMFTSALSKTVLKEHYKQLAATWKFNKYHV